DRPAAMRGLDERALLDPDYGPEGEGPGAPALGLGFALRLVRNLARSAGGSLQVGAERFELFLPARAPAGQEATGEGGG
ncbi:MAG: sensor histidine kinase, partial [Sphingomonadaceae bacterium]